MIPLVERLRQPGVIIADGAMGTLLFRCGLKPGDCPERMNLDAPEVLEEIARWYFDAGAEILQTNTFGGSPLKLAHYGLDERTEEINTAAIRAVRKSVGDRAYVSFSCGPSGKILEPYGDTRADVVYSSFCRQMKAISSGGVDMICIETMTDPAEATLAIKAARSSSSGIPICITMTFDRTPGGFRTVMGTSVETAAKALTEAGADIVGSNCGNGIEDMIQIAKEFSRHTALPLVIQSNAGLPTWENEDAVYPESPAFMAEKSRDLVKCGVKIIGGCCGTTPEHIAAIRRSCTEMRSLPRQLLSHT